MSASTEPCRSSALESASAIREQRLTSERLIHSCLAAIDARETELRAWASLDYGHALAQARAADVAVRDGAHLGPLHGVPVGIKDIFDTTDFPTGWGFAPLKERAPNEDAAVVTRLREAGAVILGKTVTTEFASVTPSKTRNPHDRSLTPGGSSSGSAAAVAAHMAPLALGSQTGGSTIRPASFCGVIGFKPSFGAISRHGCMMLSKPLGHVGLYARTVEDIVVLASVLYGADERDPVPHPIADISWAAFDAASTDLSPRFALTRTPFWERADAAVCDALECWCETLGCSDELQAPESFAQGEAWSNTLFGYEFAHRFSGLATRHGEQLSAINQTDIEAGALLTAADYEHARQGQTTLTKAVDALFDHTDVLVTLPAAGEAVSLDSTGDPIFCSVWTLSGNPAITLPLLTGPNGLPLGVQLIGRKNHDVQLLAIAASLMRPGGARG